MTPHSAVQGGASAAPSAATSAAAAAPRQSGAAPSPRRASISLKRLSGTVVQPQEASDFRNKLDDASDTPKPSLVDSSLPPSQPQVTRAGASTTSAALQQQPTAALADHTNSALGSTSKLRARKLSLSTRNLPGPSVTSSDRLPSPKSATSPSSPSALSSTSSRAPVWPATQASAGEVGLGLMLDQESQSRRSSFESVGKSDTAAGRWGLESEEGSASTSSSPSLGGGLDVFDGPARRSRAASTTSRKGDALPRLSTVTTATGTSSPLLIFTGSPNPSPSPSASSPRLFQPAPNRSPSPSHTAYNLPTSRSATPTRPASHISSQPMDRNASSSKSRELHGRHVSLTSACAPVTSSYVVSPEVQQAGFSSIVGVGNGSNGAYPPAEPVRGWKVYDWGAREKGRPDSSDDEDPRIGAKGALQHPSTLESFLNLPATLLAFFLTPLHATVPGHHHSSPRLNGSTAPTEKTLPKRFPLLIRLLTVAYLVFATSFFGLHMSSWAAGNDPSDASRYLRGKLGPRGSDGALLSDAHDDGQFMAGGMGQWAQKMAEGVRWSRGGAADSGEEGEVDLSETSSAAETSEWGLVRRLGVQSKRIADDNPLSPLSHTYRFSKMHEKIHFDQPDEIVPFTFRAASKPARDDITACFYSNEAWLSSLPAFVHAWEGPVSLVFEATHSRTSSERDALIETIAALRNSDDLVRNLVDFHIVGTPPSTSERRLNKTRAKMIERPMAQNFHINLARFFAPTEIIFIIGDARQIPSPGLKRRLQTEAITDLVLERGDAVVVPTFGFIRDPSGDHNNPKTPSLHDLRAKLDLPSTRSAWEGVSAAEFPVLAAEHILSLHETLPLPPSQWPTKKQSLVSMITTRLPSPDAPTSARLALFDRRWDLNHGPTNWYLWRKSSADPRLRDTPEAGGGTGLGIDGSVGGGRHLYRVVDYDLHYSPNVVVSRKGQPWCTERFEQMPEACVYQMYLAGAEMWVLPDEWTYTLEVIEKRPDTYKEDPAEKLKNSISSRLYGKFHQEACMHYGREFLSIHMWDSEKAQHLRETCSRTLFTWGMGLVAPKLSKAP